MEAREAGKLIQDKQALEVKLKEVQNILETVQKQRNELKQALKEEKTAREIAEARVAEVEQETNAKLAAAAAAAAAALATERAQRETLGAELQTLHQQVDATQESAATANKQLVEEAEELKGKVAALERSKTEIEVCICFVLLIRYSVTTILYGLCLVICI